MTKKEPKRFRSDHVLQFEKLGGVPSRAKQTVIRMSFPGVREPHLLRKDWREAIYSAHALRSI